MQTWMGGKSESNRDRFSKQIIDSTAREIKETHKHPNILKLKRAKYVLKIPLNINL